MTVTTLDVWNEFGHQLRSFIGRRIPNADDADDLLQEVFVKLHTRIDTLRDEERLAAWVFQITRNALIDHYRTRNGDVALHDVFSTEDEPDESDAEGQVATYLASLVEGLPEKYRQALLLTEFEGLTQKEMAARLGLSLSGAKSRVQRGREMLRQQLLDCCHFELDRRGRVIDYQPRPKYCVQCAC